MGRNTFSRDAYQQASRTYVPPSGPVTARAEQEARLTGRLNALVDPAGFGVIRRSLPRMEQRPDGLWTLTVGTPIFKEDRLDTTGSMGGNVDMAMEVLPSSFDLCSRMLPGYDLQMATGIFGDADDMFIMCRPQFEMEAQKIVEQLTLMVPERQGWGNGGEDPHYGLFGAAYLTSAYINRIGLLGYDFTISDEPARPRLDARQLERVYGRDVFDKVAENGHEISRRDLPTTREVVRDLLQRAHAFFLEVGNRYDAHGFWTDVFGADRVVVLPDIRLLPQVQATIIGLTEGTLALGDVVDFLMENAVDRYYAEAIARSVSNIPIGAQAALPNYSRRPKAGDVFAEKTDLWPMNPDDMPSTEPDMDGPIDPEAEPKPGDLEWL